MVAATARLCLLAASVTLTVIVTAWAGNKGCHAIDEFAARRRQLKNS